MTQARWTAAEFRKFQNTGKEPVPVQSLPPDKPKRKAAHTKGVMNKTEAEYARRLDALKHDGTVLSWHFEAQTLRLASNRTLTPDFLVWTPTGIEIHEVKGSHVWEDARIKFDIASEMFPMFRWYWCQKGPDGWTITERMR